MDNGDDHSGKTLKVLRTLSGLSQTEAGDALGVDQTTYSRYERGKIRLSPERIAEIMAELAFAPCDVAQDAVAVGQHSAEEVLGLNVELKSAVEWCVTAWQDGRLTKAEALSQITPLLQLQKVLRAALRARLKADA